MKKLELYTHEGCFSGTDASGFIQKVLRDFPDVFFQEVDMLEVPGRTKAAEMGIRMSPTLVYNGKIAFIGIPSEKKLRELLKAEEGNKKCAKC